MTEELTEREQIILDRFAHTIIADSDVLRAQVATLRVVRREQGHIVFAVPPGGPRLLDPSSFPIDGWYTDTDGGIVSLLLHAAFPVGELTSLEFYRPDGEPIVDGDPTAESIRTQAGHRAGGIRSFSPTEGWRDEP